MKSLCIDPGRVRLVGEWHVLDTGTCERCGVERRLYSPVVRPELKVCAPCSTIYANRSMQEADGSVPDAAGDVGGGDAMGIDDDGDDPVFEPDWGSSP